MKFTTKFISAFTAVCIALILSVGAFSTVAFATTDENGFVYSGTTLTGYTGTQTTVTIPSNIVKIGVRAFQRSNVVNVTVPSSVRVIDTEAFINSALTTITFESDEKLLQISNSAFEGCTFLESFDMPDSVTDFGTDVFLNCVLLSEVHLSTGITSIPDNTFQSCKSLATLNIPQNITSIGKNAFYECKLLTEMPIPATVKTIGESAFRYCEGIEDIDLSANTELTEIPRLAFANMYGLESIELPASIETIGKYAFYNDTLLQEITLDTNVTSIGDDAFGATSDDFLVKCYLSTIVPQYCIDNSLNYQIIYDHYTGFAEIDGKTYYFQNGVLKFGWLKIDGYWYYFAEDDGMFTGANTIDDVEFVFDADGKLTTGSWKTTQAGTRYYYGPSYYKASNNSALKFYEIGDYTYGFDNDGYRYEGINFITQNPNSATLAYEFDADGKYIGLYTGIYDGCYYVNGELCVTEGLIQIGEDYYYIQSTGEIFVGTMTVTEEYTNGLVEAGEYEFDADGKMILPQVEVKNGIIDGYYYENDEIVKSKGIVEFDGDYYYIGMRGQVFKNGNVYVTEEKANGLVAPSTYAFDENGKMIQLDTGIIFNGYYYEDGEIVKSKGIVLIDGYYYYIGMRGQVFKNGNVYVTEAKSNDLVEPSTYAFDEEGKMITENAGIILNGYYYENGEIVKSKGIVEIDGNYYYIGVRGQVFKGTVSVIEAKTNGLIPAGKYTFDENGILVL